MATIGYITPSSSKLNINQNIFHTKSRTKEKNKAFNLWIMHSQPHIEKLYFLLIFFFLLCYVYGEMIGMTNISYFFIFFFSLFFHERFFFLAWRQFFIQLRAHKRRIKLGNFSFLFCSFYFLFFLILYLLSYRIFFVHVLYVSRSFIPFIVSRCYFSFSVEITLCVRWIILMEMNEEWSKRRKCWWNDFVSF